MRRLLFSLWLLAMAGSSAVAQEWMRVHRSWADVPWMMPMRIDQVQQGGFISNGRQLNVTMSNKDGQEIVVPFDVALLDSISFVNGIADEDKGHNKYRVFAMYITTDQLAPIVERDVWIDCHIAIDGMGEYSDYSGTGLIRGRGNSTWEWYDKKPYKFKLDSKSKLLGLEKAKNWNLLANYRDVTDLMNAFAFEAARTMGMSYTNHTRFVELFLNGEYIGLYQLTEKIEVGKNRVDIDEEGGVLLSFDKDDGPELSPDDGDNFMSKVFGLPMCVKHPEAPDEERIAEIRADFAELENAVKAKDFAKVDELMDVESFIRILQMHELLYNVEIDAPRSLYMYKDVGGKYTFGPVWDWDAGYDFDWADMTTGHTFFSDYRELIYGTDPVKRIGAAYSINPFWTNMFADETFVARYKELWNATADTLLATAWGEMEKYIEQMNMGTIGREFEQWPLYGSSWWGGHGKKFTAAEETAKMKTWLENRVKYLNKVIAAYPDGATKPDSPEQTYEVDKEKGIITIERWADFALGYSQIGFIEINTSDVTDFLGGEPTSLTPLNADGSKGRNTAAGKYGAWFDEDGNTNEWAWGHVYIESNVLYTWSFGCHPGNCKAGDTHTVMMQYARGSKKMKVVVKCVVE